MIERSKRTVIGHGLLDFVLLSNGTLLTIQNMTFNGAQGFQKPVTDDFYIPYHKEYQDSTLAASGIFGKTTTERGLTYVEMSITGHMGKWIPASICLIGQILITMLSSSTIRTLGHFPPAGIPPRKSREPDKQEAILILR